MLHRLLFVALFGAATFVPTADAQEPPAVAEGLAAVAELGRINGQALACGHGEVVARAKTVMVATAPKTRRYGAAFEEATREAFLAQGRGGATCPESAALMARLEGAAARLVQAFPPAR